MNFARKEKFILWESSCFDFFGEEKYGLLLIQKVDVRWYFCSHGIPCFLNSEKFLFWTFRRWKIRSFFDSKSWCKMIFSSAWNTMFFEYWKVLVLNFSEIGSTVFFDLKSWLKVDFFLVFLNFSWYSSTWEIWFFVQCILFVS